MVFLATLVLSACGATSNREAALEGTVVALQTQVAQVAPTATTKLERQPIATELPTATPVPPTVMPTPLPTETPTVAPPTHTPIEMPSPEPTATATPSGPVAVVKSATLNVRAGPATSHAAVTSVKSGTTLDVIGRNDDGSWLQVTLPSGASGWVSSQLVTLNMNAKEVAVAKEIPTPPPAPTPEAAPKPATGPEALEVTFINPHYDCVQGEWGDNPPVWGYRGFQVDMYIKNNGATPVNPPWKPKRWIITDGTNDFVNDLAWQWVSRSRGYYPQPVIQPGQVTGWTFLAFPMDRNQWVKAVEFVWEGQTYRGTFDLGPYGNAYNYQDCGDPRPHKFVPTPTPRP